MIPKRDWTPADIDRLKDLVSAGHSATYIAVAMGGMTRNTVLGKLHRLGIKLRTKLAGQVAVAKARRMTPAKVGRKPKTAAAAAPIKKAPEPKLETLDDMPARGWPKDHGPSAMLFSDPANTRMIHCQMPLWDDTVPQHERKVCGEPVKPGHSWCVQCCRLVYQPRVPKAKAA
jgi:hypothetical protein